MSLYLGRMFIPHARDVILGGLFFNEASAEFQYSESADVYFFHSVDVWFGLDACKQYAIITSQ